MLFDGDCNLCHGAVQWILRRDRRAVFAFAALASGAGRALVAGTGAQGVLPDSLVLVAAGRLHVRSGAALRIALRLRWPWPLLGALLVVPWPLRDLVYDWIARNRYRWFGRRTSCMVPTPELRARFLDADDRR